MWSILRATRHLPVISLLGLAVLLTAAPAQGAPAVAGPFVGIYTLATFAGVPPAGATKPDDLALSADGTELWVGYGNNADTTGKSGSSTVVEYDIGSGAVRQNVAIPGHLDGLKINPRTGNIWATENEDGNPTLAIINHTTGQFRIYTFQATLITGGMDDLVFVGDSQNEVVGSQNDDNEEFGSRNEVFIVASSQTDITKPVIVEISGKPQKANTVLLSVQAGNPSMVWNVVTNAAETTDQIADPDSLTLDPAGELVLDNRSDDSLYIVRAAGAPQPVLRVPLTLAGQPVEVNDTIFTTSATSGASSSAGILFITDTTANAIYMLSKPYFPANEVYTAANVVGAVGLVDLSSGVVTPVVTGFQGVHGLAFAPTSVALGEHQELGEENAH